MAGPVEIGRLQGLITADDRDYVKKMKAADQLGAQTAKKIGGHFSNLRLSIPKVSGAGLLDAAGAVAGGNVLTSILGKVTGGMTDAITTGVNYNKMLEATGVAFETLGMSQAEVVKHQADLQKLALKTPFNFQDLVKASLTMNAFGFSTQTRIQDLKSLSDAAAIAAAGTGDFKGALEGVIIALGQMRAKGKVSAEEMNQLAERGIPAWDILSKKVGLTKAELMKLGEQGRLRGDIAATLLTEGLGQFAGGAGDKLATTILGKESNVQDAFAQRAGKDTQALTEAYGRALDTAFDQISKGAGQSFTTKVGDTLSKNLDFINQAISGQISGKEFLGALKMAGSDMWKAVQEGFVGAISTDGKTAFESVKQWAGGLIDSAKSALGIKSPSTVFAEIAGETIAGFDQGWESGKKKIQRITVADLVQLGAGAGFSEDIVKAMLKVFKPGEVARLLKEGIGFGPGFFTSGSSEIDAAIKKQAARTGVPAELLFAQQFRESRFNVNAVSSAGAEGPAQFMPATAQRFNLGNPFDIGEATRAQADYMRQLLDKFDKFTNAESLALAGFNAGENRKSLAAGRVPNITETQGYVSEITRVLEAIRQAAPSAPALTQTFQAITGTAGKAPIPGGGASVNINSGRDLVPLAEIPKDFARLSTETTKARAALNPLPLPMKEIAAAGPKAAGGIDAVTKATKEQIKTLLGVNRTKELQGAIAKDFDDLVEQLAAGQERVTDTLRGFVRSFALDVLNQLQSSLIEGLTGEKSIGAYLGKIIGGFLGGLFGFRAGGGDVMAGRPYVVGEEGKELFVPQRNGRIIPADQTARMLQGGGGQQMVVINNHFTINTPTGKIAPETQAQIATRTGIAINAAIRRNT